MPQFDTFSFSSQLFWVFLCFSCLYFSLSYYLLPSISVILKIRKRKLSSTTVISSKDDSSLTTNMNIPFVTISSKEMTIALSGNSFSFNTFVLKHNLLKLIPLNFYYKIPSLIML
mgnify:CR=1 FL=1|jgi:hypothetical protein